jgi:hypothetical protein
LPCDQHPGRIGHEIAYPSSDFCNTTWYFMTLLLAAPPGSIRSPGPGFACIPPQAAPLTVGSRYFRAVANPPLLGSFEGSRKFVVHLSPRRAPVTR